MPACDKLKKNWLSHYLRDAVDTQLGSRRFEIIIICLILNSLEFSVSFLLFSYIVFFLLVAAAAAAAFYSSFVRLLDYSQLAPTQKMRSQAAALRATTAAASTGQLGLSELVAAAAAFLFGLNMSGIAFAYLLLGLLACLELGLNISSNCERRKKKKSSMKRLFSLGR